MEPVRKIANQEDLRRVSLLLADTTSSHNVDLQAKQWLKVIIDTARKMMYFLQVSRQLEVPQGYKDLVQPIRPDYITTWAASAAEGAAVSYTTMDTLKGITFTPTDKNYGIAISNRALRINAINLITAAREELSYKYAEEIDQAIRAAIEGATDATSTTKGAQTIYGGNASNTVDVAAGDVLTTDLIAKARRLLMSTDCYYWTAAGEFAKSSAKKAPWMPTDAEPFVLFIAPEQYETLITDPQFVNAAEFGGREVVLNGEITQYLGIRIVVSPNLSAKTSADAGWATNGHVCLMVKSMRSVGLAWGQRPRIQMIDYPSELERRIILEMAYDAKAIHADAIVKINVADA